MLKLNLNYSFYPIRIRIVEDHNYRTSKSLDYLQLEYEHLLETHKNQCQAVLPININSVI